MRDEGTRSPFDARDDEMLQAAMVALKVCFRDGNGLEAVTALQAIAAKDFELDGECLGCGHADSEHANDGCKVAGYDCQASCEDITPALQTEAERMQLGIGIGAGVPRQAAESHSRSCGVE